MMDAMQTAEVQHGSQAPPRARGQGDMEPIWPLVFDAQHLAHLGEQLQPAYQAASPFPHVIIDDFLPAEAAARILDEFPKPGSPIWLERDPDHQPGKFGMGHVRRLGTDLPYTQQVLMALNAFPIINFLERLTGISGLTPDPHYMGGGLHQTGAGGSLAIHSDFNFHRRLRLFRRINLLIYLNRDWRDEYGGNLELWDRDMTECVVSVAPVFNRCVIFNTDQHSFHGQPDPLNTPEGVTRNSLALYYFTASPREGEEASYKTLWQLRPIDQA